ETRRFHFEAVRAAGDSRVRIDAVLVGGGAPGSAARLVARRDGGSDDGPARGVGDPAGQAGADFLGVQGQGEHHDGNSANNQIRVKNRAYCMTLRLRIRHEFASPTWNWGPR